MAGGGLRWGPIGEREWAVCGVEGGAGCIWRSSISYARDVVANLSEASSWYVCVEVVERSVKVPPRQPAFFEVEGSRRHGGRAVRDRWRHNHAVLQRAATHLRLVKARILYPGLLFRVALSLCLASPDRGARVVAWQVKLAVSGLAAHRRRNSAVAASEAVSAEAAEATDSQRIYRRWD